MDREMLLNAFVQAYANSTIDVLVDERLRRNELRPYKRDLDTIEQNVDRLISLLNDGNGGGN